MKLVLVLGLLAIVIIGIESKKKANCGKAPPKDADFKSDKTCSGVWKKNKTAQCCCLCNGKPQNKKPGPGAGWYCNREYCNGGNGGTGGSGATTTAGTTSTSGATTTTAGSTSTSTGSTSTSTSTTTGSTSTTTGSTTTTTTSTTASG